MALKIFKNLSRIKFFGNIYFQLSLIVIFGLFLRLLFFSGLGISDELVYSKYSNNINKGSSFDSEVYFSTRLGIIYVTALSYSFFGVNDYSSILFVLLTSLGSIILIFYFGKLLFNEKVGLIAALLLSFFPLDVVYSTKLLSDVPSAFFVALGIYSFLYFEKMQKLKYRLGYFLSGVFIGIGYLIRESALLIALFFITYILYRRELRKEYFLVPLGVLVIFLVEILIFLALTGDPLSRIHASQVYNTEAVVNLYNYFGRLEFPTGLFHYPWLLFTNNLLLFFYIFISIAIYYFLVYKRKETYDMLFWLLPLLLYLSFGSSSFSQYIPFKAADRYLTIVTLPGILLLAFFLKDKNEIIKRAIAPMILILLFFTSVGTLYLRHNTNPLNDLKEAYAYLEKLDGPVYIDGRSLIALEYISRYNEGFILNEYPNDLNKVKNAYVVVNKRMIKEVNKIHPNLKFSEQIYNIPSRWKIIKEIGKNEEDKIIIYFAP